MTNPEHHQTLFIGIIYVYTKISNKATHVGGNFDYVFVLISLRLNKNWLALNVKKKFVLCIFVCENCPYWDKIYLLSE